EADRAIGRGGVHAGCEGAKVSADGAGGEGVLYPGSPFEYHIRSKVLTVKRIAVHLSGLLALLLAFVPPASAQPGAYRIGPRDLIELRVFEVPDLNLQRRVAEDGTINLPLLGDVAVAGLSEAEPTQSLN